MTETLKVTVLGFTPYSFEDDKGKIVEGCNVWFVEEKAQNDDYGQGFIPKKARLPFEYRHTLAGVAFPYLASPELVTRFTSKGAKTEIESFKLLQPVKLQKEALKL